MKMIPVESRFALCLPRAQSHRADHLSGMPSCATKHSHRLARMFVAVLLPTASLGGCSHSVAQNAAAPPPPPIEYVDTWGSHGRGPGELAAPAAIATDGESIIYITDAASGYIHKFSASGEPRLSFQDDRMDLQPADIAVDAGAAIYVADPKRRVVVIF